MELSTVGDDDEEPNGHRTFQLVHDFAPLKAINFCFNSQYKMNFFLLYYFNHLTKPDDPRFDWFI